MKKLLFVIHDLGHGGAERVLVNLVNHLDRSKFNISVMALFGGGVNEQYLKEDINLIVCHKKAIKGNSKIMELFTPKQLFKHYIKEEYDIIVSYLEGPSARIVSGCDNPNTKLVSWIHCKMADKKAVSSSFRSFAEAKKCYERFDNTVCVSKWVKNYFVKALDFQNKIEVLYNTIETDRIKELSDEAIEDVVFDTDCVNICSVGKVVELKGFDRLAGIHKRLVNDGIKNHIYILGVGDAQSKIEKYLADNNLTDTFTFLGFKNNPYKYVKACDLYVCSSWSEGFSTAVTESLIVGTPVVTTLCSGMHEMLGENNEYGIVTENNEDALYEGIKKMLTTPSLLEHYAEKALERGEEFSTEKTTEAVEEMLINL